MINPLHDQPLRLSALRGKLSIARLLPFPALFLAPSYLWRRIAAVSTPYARAPLSTSPAGVLVYKQSLTADMRFIKASQDASVERSVQIMHCWLSFCLVFALTC